MHGPQCVLTIDKCTDGYIRMMSAELRHQDCLRGGGEALTDQGAGPRSLQMGQVSLEGGRRTL